KKFHQKTLRSLSLGPRRARALTVRTGVSVAHRPRARIAWGATPAHVRYSLDEHERQRASRLPARSVLDGPHWGPAPPKGGGETWLCTSFWRRTYLAPPLGPLRPGGTLPSG